MAVLFAVAVPARGQAPLPIYTDHLVNGFQDWSWGTHNLANTAPVHSGSDSIYPPFYAAKLAHYFAQPGDSILDATSDYPLLAAYGARSAAGAVSLLVLNKDTTTNFNARISLAGFTPGTTATLRSFGTPQDEAARTNGPAPAQDIATNSFTPASATFDYSFAPLSLTLFTLAPAAPQLTALAH